MLGNAFGWPHLLIILVILLLLFGAPKLPALAKSIAQSMKIFKTEINHSDKGSGSGAAADGTTPTTSANGTTPAPTGAASTDYPPKS
jgi:sec-independent protein translocase protein TatA